MPNTHPRIQGTADRIGRFAARNQEPGQPCPMKAFCSHIGQTFRYQLPHLSAGEPLAGPDFPSSCNLLRGRAGIEHHIVPLEQASADPLNQRRSNSLTVFCFQEFHCIQLIGGQAVLYGAGRLLPALGHQAPNGAQDSQAFLLGQGQVPPSRGSGARSTLAALP